MEKAREHPGEIFNAGSGKATALKEVVDDIFHITASKSGVSWGKPMSSYDAPLWQADMQKTFSAFSWRPKHSLRNGLEKTIEWYRKSSLGG